MNTPRLARRLGLDRSPLRRRTDKVASCLAVLLLAVFVIGAPVLSVAAAGWAGRAAAAGQRAARSWRQVPAVLLHATPPLTAAGAVSGGPLVPARWTAPDGRSRTGRIPAGAGLAAGRTVRLWVDTAGLPTGHSPSSSALVADQVLAAAGSHRAGDRAGVAGMGGAVGARPATASRLGSGMGCCRPSVDPALLVTGSALTAGRLATSRSGTLGRRSQISPAGQQRGERGTMTAAQPEDLGRQGVRSLEVRWIFPGQLAGAVTGWFGRFPAETTELEDAYLLDPHLPGLSVKVRGRWALEVKAYRGSPELLEVAGRARGRVESWQKWTFPHGPPSPGSAHQAGWRPVRKRRRISWWYSRTRAGRGGPARRAAGAGGRGT